jgi:hypothetical protein
MNSIKDGNEIDICQVEKSEVLRKKLVISTFLNDFSSAQRGQQVMKRSVVTFLYKIRQHSLKITENWHDIDHNKYFVSNCFLC